MITQNGLEHVAERPQGGAALKIAQKNSFSKSLADENSNVFQPTCNIMKTQRDH
jgi:hypothetical protein